MIFSEHAKFELEAAYSQISATFAAQRLWERVLSSHDRRRLGGDLKEAFAKEGTVGMWMTLRGVSVERAIIDVARKIDVMNNGTAEWLMREIGDESDDPDAMIAAAVATGALVLVDMPRTAYWDREPIDVDWGKRTASWHYLWELARQSKKGNSIDSQTLSEEFSLDYVHKQKSRLTGLCDTLCRLGECIESAGPGNQKLSLRRDMIRLYQREINETVREITG